MGHPWGTMVHTTCSLTQRCGVFRTVEKQKLYHRGYVQSKVGGHRHSLGDWGREHLSTFSWWG